MYGTFILFIITTDLPTVSFVTFLADRITVCTNTDPSFSASGPLPAVVDFRVVSNLSNDGGRRFIQRLCDLIRLCYMAPDGLQTIWCIFMSKINSAKFFLDGNY